MYISDILDELLKEMDFNENYVVVKINLTSVDNAIATLGSFNGIKGIAGGDIAKLDLDAVRKDNQTRAKRGDMNIIYDTHSYQLSILLQKLTLFLISLNTIFSITMFSERPKSRVD